MLQMRARSFALRDQFGDALRGLRSAEEMRDGQVIDVDAQPSQPSRPLFPPPNRIAERVTESSDTVTDSSVIAPPPPPPEPIEAAGGAESTQVAPEMTAQQAELAAAVASVGCTFNDLVRWADSANWDDFSACADFIDLPGKAVQRLLAAKKGLSEALKRFKENGK
jgi:hypothetical protein